MIRKLYPYGKKKAFNVTYDDGVLQDIPFVKLLNKYHLKGTFNLNSELIKNQFEWTHENGSIIKRLSADKVVSLYDGHEIASHTLTHPYLKDLTENELLHQLSQDKINLEKLFGREVRGFAIPFDYYNPMIENCVKKCGFEYGRISQMSHSFQPQKDYYNWKATVFHCEEIMEELTDSFLVTNDELAIFQIVGHSYDLDVENKWELIENIFKRISNQNDILPMTTIEIINYLKAMEKAEFSDSYITNKSNISLWFDIDNTIAEIPPNETYNL